MATLLLNTPFTAFFPVVPHGKTRLRSLSSVAMSFYLFSPVSLIVRFSGEMECEFEKRRPDEFARSPSAVSEQGSKQYDSLESLFLHRLITIHSYLQGS